MKHLSYLFAAFFCCCMSLHAKEKVIEKPSFMVWTSNSMEIRKIVLSDTATVFFIEAHYHPNMWIKIASGSYLVVDGKQYPIRSGVGMELNKEIWMSDSGTCDFQMIFPPLPEDTKEVSFTEGPNIPGGFSIFGIRLDGKQVTLPMADKIFPVEKPVLETPEFNPGIAILRGKLLKYWPDMGIEGTIYVFNVLTNKIEECPLEVRADGSFCVKIPLLHISGVTLQSSFMNKTIYLKPGAETILTVNLPEYCRTQSLFRKDEQSLGRIYHFEGALAALNNEIGNLPMEELNVSPASKDDYMQMFKEISVMDVDQYKAYWLKRYHNGLKELDKYPQISKTSRTLLKQDAGIIVAKNLLGASNIIEYAYRTTNNIPFDSVLTDYVKPVVDISYYDFMTELVPNTPDALYSKHYGSLLKSIQYSDFTGKRPVKDILKQDTVPLLTEVMKTDHGILFDLLAIQNIVNPICEFVPLTDQQLAKVDAYPFLKGIVISMNDKLKQTIENNKKLSSYIVNHVNVVEVPEEEVFRAILTPYRGKVVFVDFWATWCAPCRDAMKQTEPVKKDYEGKDVVFLYIAGENSPLETWKQMISKIEGEHYRVTQKQWNYLWQNLALNGIPTYMIIAKDGTPVHSSSGFMGVISMKEMLQKELDK